MTIITVRSRKIIPVSGGETMTGGCPIMMYYGNADTIPSGWYLYSLVQGACVSGSSGSQINSPYAVEDSSSHSHSNGVLSTISVHTHSGEATCQNSTSAADTYATTSTMSAASHNHGAKTSTGTMSIGNSGEHSHDISDTLSTSPFPESRALYWIKGLTSSASVPTNAIAFYCFSASSLAGGWNVCDGSASAIVDMRHKFVYGASSDAELGERIGGSHVHTNVNTETSGSHRHTISGTWSGGATTSAGHSDLYFTAKAGHGGGHGSFSTYTPYEDGHEHTMPDTTGHSAIPPSVILYYTQKTSTEDSLGYQRGQIIAWDTDSIPSGWTICDGRTSPCGVATPDMRDRFVYGGDPAHPELINTYAGSQTHTHTYLSGSITSTTGSHKHGGTVTVTSPKSYTGTASGRGGGTGKSVPPETHSHTGGHVDVYYNTSHYHNLDFITGSGTSIPRHVKFLFIMRDA